MQPDDRDLAFLFDMLRHARGAARAIEGRTREDYAGDENLRLAVERRLEIIGEAAGRISDEFKASRPEIPWRKIVAQRNVLAHGYAEIEDDIIWQVVTVSVPELLDLLERLVPDDAGSEEGPPG